MHISLNKRVNSLAAALACSCAMASTNTLAASLSIIPVTHEVISGNTVEVGIEYSRDPIFPEESISVFDLGVSYNSTVLEFMGLTFGDPALGDQLDLFSLGGNLTDVIPNTGSVEILEVSLDDPVDLESLQLPTFQLVVLSFNAVGIGTSPIEITVNDLGNAYGDPLTPDVTNGAITVVPIPASAWLFGFGLLGLTGMARRTKTES